MKKICFFNSSDFWGGGEKLHLENAKAFRAKGYEVTIAAHQDSELWKRSNEEGFETFAVTVGSTSFLNIFKLLRIKSYFQKEKIESKDEIVEFDPSQKPTKSTQEKINAKSA